MLEELPVFVTDFDGTITDPWKTAEKYQRIHRQLISELWGIPTNELEDFYTLTEKLLLGEPRLNHYKVEGTIVGPATVDPYIQESALTVLAATNFDKKITQEKQGEIFAKSYNQVETVYRPYAGRFLDEMRRQTNLVVVTNSSTDGVTKKVNYLLGPDHGIRIVGNAKKMAVDPNMVEVSESMQPEGFPHPVSLQRKSYYDVFQTLGDVKGVFGDIFEFDLALAIALQELNSRGRTLWPLTFLMATEHTPKWELDYYKNHLTGRTITTLYRADEIILQALQQV